MTRSYDSMDLYRQILLDLRLTEGTGTNVQDWAKPAHVCTLTGTPTWQNLANDQPYLDFNAANPDTITSQAGASGDLDFTTRSFSGAAWIAPDLAGNRFIFWKGAGGLATGWAFCVNLDGVIPDLDFYTGQAGPTIQVTTGATGLVNISGGVWQLVGFTRNGASARIYYNGVDATDTAGTHVNPASAAAANFIIGTNNLAGGMYDGDMWRPRLWGRALSAAEMKRLYDSERAFLGL